MFAQTPVGHLGDKHSLSDISAQENCYGIILLGMALTIHAQLGGTCTPMVGKGTQAKPEQIYLCSQTSPAKDL